jgi:hypothetical protein
MSSTLTPAQPSAPRTFPVPQLIFAMLKSHGHVSDLIFSPGRAPQVEVNGLELADFIENQPKSKSRSLRAAGSEVEIIR